MCLIYLFELQDSTSRQNDFNIKEPLLNSNMISVLKSLC